MSMPWSQRIAGSLPAGVPLDIAVLWCAVLPGLGSLQMISNLLLAAVLLFLAWWNRYERPDGSNAFQCAKVIAIDVSPEKLSLASLLVLLTQSTLNKLISQRNTLYN